MNRGSDFVLDGINAIGRQAHSPQIKNTPLAPLAVALLLSVPPKDSMVHYIENQSVVICCLSRFGRLQPGGSEREPTRE